MRVRGQQSAHNFTRGAIGCGETTQFHGGSPVHGEATHIVEQHIQTSKGASSPSVHGGGGSSLWREPTPSQHRASVPSHLAGTHGIWKAIPKSAQGFTHTGLKLLAITADLHLPVLVPWIQQVPRALERQVAPVLPLDEVAASARVAAVLIGGPVHVGGRTLEHSIALEVTAALHREDQHNLLALPDGGLDLAIGGSTQGPEARGDRDVHRPVGARLDDVEALATADHPLRAQAAGTGLPAAARAHGRAVRPVVGAPRAASCV